MNIRQHQESDSPARRGRLKWCVGTAAVLLLLIQPARAAIVEFAQVSDPPGIIVQTNYLDTPVNVTTVTAPVSSGSYRFTHWTINNVRYDDDTGRSQNPVSFTLYEPTTAIAHYLPATQDSDADGIPDWYEIEYYANLAQNAISDTDADGFNLAAEYASGYHPRVKDELVSGGLARTRSAIVTMNLNLSPTYRLVSSPPGFVNSSNVVTWGTVITTPDLWGQNVSGYRFAYWDLDGVRQQDIYGIALGGFSFTVTNDTVATAHYYQSSQDSDSDGVADWFEYVYYPTLAQNGVSDTDADGFTLAQELAQSSVPTLKDEIVLGGISRGRSGVVAVNLLGFPTYRLVSSPSGFINSSAIVNYGTVVTTPDLWGQSVSGYRFAYWDRDGVRQQDIYGIALGVFSFTVTTDTVATAHYFPSSQDSDLDGVADWFEYVYYSTLAQSGGSDTDADGFTLAQELAQGTAPTLKNEIVLGGISRGRAASGTIMDLQPFERLQYALVNGVLTNFFGGVAFGANAAPALGDWDGDGDLDLFVASAPGSVRVFENIGSRYTMDLSERTANFSGLASAWSGINSPVLALGDWNADGWADLIVGGDGGTVRIISSTGHFGTGQSPAVNYAFATGSTKNLPALADLNGDGRRDLLVLIDDGTVRLYLHSGNNAAPYAVGTFTANILPQPVPNATGIAAADINYDGRVDVLVSDADGRVWEFYQNSTPGTFTLMSKVWGGTGVGFANSLAITAADIDGDGDIDMIGGTAEGGLVALQDPRLNRPTNLQAFGGADSILLQWDPNRSSRISGYNAYRATASNGTFQVQNLAALPLPTYLDTGVVFGTTYYYNVTALRQLIYPGNSIPKVVESLPSEIVSATVGQIVLWMPDYYANTNTIAWLHVNAQHADGISGTGLDIRITYDPTVVVPVSQVLSNQTTVERTVLTENFIVTDNSATASGELRIQSSGDGTIMGDGKLFDVKFYVLPTVAQGAKQTNTFSYVSLRNAQGTPLGVDFSDKAVLTVQGAYSLGDLDGDGQLTVPGDHKLVMELANGKRAPTPQELAAGDLNGNGIIDKDDAHLILRLIHGRGINP